VKRVEFDMEVRGVGNYKGRMYKAPQNLIIVALERV